MKNPFVQKKNFALDNKEVGVKKISPQRTQYPNRR
jgi:hypothetical protein